MAISFNQLIKDCKSLDNQKRLQISVLNTEDFCAYSPLYDLGLAFRDSSGHYAYQIHENRPATQSPLSEILGARPDENMEPTPFWVLTRTPIISPIV